MREKCALHGRETSGGGFHRWLPCQLLVAPRGGFPLRKDGALASWKHQAGVSRVASRKKIKKFARNFKI